VVGDVLFVGAELVRYGIAKEVSRNVLVIDG